MAKIEHNQYLFEYRHEGAEKTRMLALKNSLGLNIGGKFE